MNPDQSTPSLNEDRTLWQSESGDSIHVTKHGAIGIAVGGHVIVMSLDKWHQIGLLRLILNDLNEP